MASRSTALSRALDNRHLLGLFFMLPAAALLLLFLTYPLGLGTWLGFTDAKIGRPGEWIGLENFEFLGRRRSTRLSLFNTLFYTAVASIIKFALGLWLALLLNKHIPFKSSLRAVVLLPFIVPDGAVGDRVLVDLRRAVLDRQLGAGEDGDHRPVHRFPRRAHGLRGCRRSSPTSGAACRSSRSTLLAGLQTISPSFYEAASLDGASDWQQFRLRDACRCSRRSLPWS